MFSIFPNMYIVLVGPSGSRKGTAMSSAYPFLRELGVKLAAEAITREALIRELRQSSNTQIDAQGRPVMHCSLTVHSQELTVFLGYNNMQLMADLCDWFDCKDRWIYRTKNAGTDEIIGVWVNLFGGTTPTLLQATLPQDAIGGGLTARMIIVSEKKKGKTITVPFLTKEELVLQKVLMSDLEQVLILSGDFKITGEFLDKWRQWYPAQDANPPFNDARLLGYIERRPIHTLKLSMIMNASRTNKMIIELEDLERAIQYLTEVEKRMPYAFSGVGQAKLGNVLVRIWSTIAQAKTIKTSELMQQYHYDIDAEDISGILRTLETMRVIVIAYSGTDPVIHYKGVKGMEDQYGIGG